MPKGCSFAPRCPYATDKCRSERPETYTTETGHYARCHYSMDAEFVRKNAPANSRTRAAADATKGGEA